MLVSPVFFGWELLISWSICPGIAISTSGKSSNEGAVPVSNLLIKPRFYLSEYITIPTKFFFFLILRMQKQKKANEKENTRCVGKLMRHFTIYSLNIPSYYRRSISKNMFRLVWESIGKYDINFSSMKKKCYEHQSVTVVETHKTCNFSVQTDICHWRRKFKPDFL